MNRSLLFIHFALAVLVAFGTVNCGGGGSKQQFTTPPTIQTPPALSITTTSVPDGVITKPYTFTLQSTGGSGTKAWNIVSGTLPAGLNLDGASGTISGTPSVMGFSNVSFRVSDSSGNTQSPTFSFAINPILQINDINLFNISRGVQFTSSFISTNTLELRPAITWTILSPALPPGLGLLPVDSPNQIRLSGVPRQVGTFPFTLQAQDSSIPQQTATKTFTVTVGFGQPTLHGFFLPRATVNVPYSYHLFATGGVLPHHWNASFLPQGLTLSADGLLSGTPTVASASSDPSPFITVTDASSFPQTSSSSFALSVAPGFRGRNDGVRSATAIGDVIFSTTTGGSISPFADPTSTSPDSDYFSFTASAGAVLDVRTDFTFDPLHPNPLDTVIEILDSNGNRFQTCRNLEDDGLGGSSNIVKDPTPSAFDDDCLNDDDPARGTTDSTLSFQVPAGSGPVTFIVHVFDWRGDARPDMTYSLQVTRLQ